MYSKDDKILTEGTIMVKTIRSFLEEVGGLSFDNGDFWVVRDKFRDDEIQAFVNCFLPGTEILRNGKNGAPVALKGMADDNKGTTGSEEIDFHGLQLYDFSDATGEWVVVTFPDLETLEKHLLSEAGYLNFYSTQMFVFEDGVHKPFEIMFNGDNDTVIGIDKDQFEVPLDIPRLQGRIWVRWMDPEELKMPTDEDIEAYKRSIGR